MDIKDLQCFVATAETLNFTRAAERIFLSQSSLSLRISALETELGHKLFFRDSRHVYLTLAGSVLLPEAKRLLGELDGLRAYIDKAAEELASEGKLKIAVDPDEDMLGTMHVNETIHEFMREYPSICVEITTANPFTYQEALSENKCDLLILRLTNADTLNSAFDSLQLFSEEHFLVASSKLKDMSIDEILKTKTLYLLKNSRFSDLWNGSLLSKLGQLNYFPSIKYVDSLVARQLAVLSEDNCTIMPALLCEQFDPRQTVCYRLPGAFNTILTLIWNRENLNPVIQLFQSKFRFSQEDI